MKRVEVLDKIIETAFDLSKLADNVESIWDRNGPHNKDEEIVELLYYRYRNDQEKLIQSLKGCQEI